MYSNSDSTLVPMWWLRTIFQLKSGTLPMFCLGHITLSSDGDEVELNLFAKEETDDQQHNDENDIPFQAIRLQYRSRQ